MTSERWRLVERLYHAALAEEPEARSAFLMAACGEDRALRQEIESLLVHTSPPGLLDRTDALPANDAADRVEVPADRWIGRRLGVYTIVSPIGAGTMGEVYRARDGRLGRDVAIKILPPLFTDDHERLARFEREARVLASLNHPNIATIHGVEERSEIRALVMELVDGDTLEERIEGRTSRGPRLSTAEALAIAGQIVDALDAAHERGVVHRDLKPANIKITPDGVVKVLDFGLAKAGALTEPLFRSAESPDEAGGTDTWPGRIVGTPVYMSPEQARGDVVDKRADIWAFGCVLYEMLIGRPPFDDTTASAVFAQARAAETDLESLPHDTPPAIRRLLRRCLEKAPRDRLRDIADARAEISEALDVMRSSRRPVPPRHLWHVNGRRLLAYVSVVALAGVVGWWIASSTAGESPLVVRLSIPSLEPPFAPPFGEHHVAVSDDGARVVYASATRLWIREMDSPEGVGIQAAAANPFFSPDGEWVAFFVRGGDLMKVSIAGGTPVLIAAITGRPAGGDWRRDGAIVYATTEGLYQVDASGGASRQLAKPTAKVRTYAWPQFLPDERSVLFTLIPETSLADAQVAVLDLRTSDVTVVLERAGAARYSATGHLVFGTGRQFKAVAFDPAGRRTVGEPTTVPGVSITIARDNGAAEFALSRTGTLVYLAPPAARESARTLYWIDREGLEEPVPITPGVYLFPRWSPGGTRLALDVPGANRDVWTWDADRPTLTRLTTGPAEDMLPTWSVDGRVFFASQRQGNFDLYSRAGDGATPERPEFVGPGDQMPQGFTPDGRQLIVNQNFRDISILTLTSPPRLDPLLHSDSNEWLGEVSPDGKWIAYESDESGGRFEILLRSFPDVTGRREKVSIDGGRYPLWNPSGNGELFYVDLSGAMMSATIRLSPTLALGPVRKLFDASRPPAVITARPYDISTRDGRFIFSRVGGSSQTPRLVDLSVILNWHAELRRLMSSR